MGERRPPRLPGVHLTSDPGADDPRPTQVAGTRAATAAIITAYAVQGLAFGALVVRVPALQDQVGASTQSLALGLALVPVVAGLGSLLGGLAVHHAGSRLVLRLAGPAVPLMVLVASTSTSMTQLVLTPSAVGLVLGAADASMAIQATIVQRTTGRPVIGRGYAAFAVGGIAASLIASASAQAGWSAAQTALLVAAVAVPTSLLSGRYLPRSRYHHESPPDEPTAPTSVSRRLARPALAVVTAQVVDASVSTWAALFLHVGLGVSEAGAALGYGAYALASTGARILSDKALTRVTTRAIITTAISLGLTGALLLAASNSLWPALTALAVIGLGAGPIVPTAFVIVGRNPHSPAGDIARLNVCNYLGYLIGTPMVSAVAASAGIASSIPISATVLIGAIPLAIREEQGYVTTTHPN